MEGELRISKGTVFQMVEAATTKYIRQLVETSYIVIIIMVGRFDMA